MRVLPSATGAALAAAATLLLAAPAALATPPGDNGDVKIHRTTTPQSDERNEPKVCAFYLDAFNFDGLQSVSWTIDVQPRHGSKDHALSGAITLGQDGNGRTDDLSLPDGQYKLYWTFAGEHGSGKHKVFKVDCSDEGGTGGTPTPTGSATPTQSGTPTTSPTPTDSGTAGTPSGGGTQGATGGTTAPGASPTATDSTSGGSLASTGASVGGIAGVAALLLGVGAFVRFRKRGTARQH
jgi:hypothetical protein